MNNAPPAILDSSNVCSPLSVPANRTALLLLDFHTFIVNSQPDAGANVLAATASLRSWARAKGIIVIHCNIDFNAVTPPKFKMSSKANSAHEKMSKGDNAAQEAIAAPAAVAVLPGEFVFTRPPSHVSALGSYGIETFLAAHEIESLVLTGFSTSMCVLNTAKGAADAGYVVTIVKDACGDKSKEMHDTIVNKVVIGQTHVVEQAEFTTAWDANSIESLNKLSIEA